MVTERRNPLAWAKTQQEIGEIYYRLGKESADKDLLEEALEYFHDALYIFENADNKDETQKLNADIAKTSHILALSR